LARRQKFKRQFEGGGYDSANRRRKKQRTRNGVLRTCYQPKKPTESAGKYIGLPYTQHNPEVPKNGPEGFIEFIGGMFKKHPDLKVVIHRAVADEKFVALLVHLKREKSDPGIAVAEFFRVENGKDC
jgi:predicted SnoaL-like aldol condensation-catalyzing enzyme